MFFDYSTNPRISKRLKGVWSAALLGTVFALTGGEAQGAAYYVNDVSTNGDVYATAVGNDINAGTTPGAPKRSLTNLLATVTLAPGDIVYIDTGIYAGYSVTIPGTVNGVSGNPITFQGSTNWLAGGSVLDRNSNAAEGLTIIGDYLVINDLRVTRARRGIYFFNAEENLLQRVYSYSNSLNGFEFGNSKSNRLVHSVSAWNPDSGIRSSGLNFQNNSAEFCVLWENNRGVNVAGIGQGLFYISNSVISVTGSASRAYFLSGFGRLVGDYNAICRRDGAVVMGEDQTINFTAYHISDWQTTYTQELFSVCGGADFAAPGLLDFHPKSITGRYDPFTQAFVTDTVHSILIDLGNPALPVGSEPSPNGGRVNVGPFGQTSEASLSRTNPWLQVVSYNDGGLASVTGRFYWTYGGFTNGSTVTIGYSHDNGVSWTSIATAVQVTNTPLVLSVGGLTPSLAARWRLVSDSNPGLLSTNAIFFSLRPSTSTVFSLYVNDAVVTGDVYTVAAGSTANSGLTSSDPAGSIQQVLDAYYLVGGDTVYVDSGTYTGSAAGVIMSTADQGTSNRFLRIVGSTNDAAGGAWLDRGNTSQEGFELRGQFVEVNGIKVRNARNGLLISQGANNNRFVGVMAANCGSAAIRGASGVTGNRLENCIAIGSPIGVAGFGLGNYWERGVCWSNAAAFNIGNVNNLSVSNSVIVGGVAFDGAGVPFAGDYNLFWNTSIGAGYNNLNELQKVTDGWWNSTYGDPQFADPADFNFYPRSQTGRYSPQAGGFVTGDSTTSILVDFGNPSDVSYTNEPAPNGNRMNAGASGGTSRASKSRTNAWLQVLTYNGGGQLTAPGDEVYWTFGQLPTGSTVRIEYSGDGGGSWAVVATNLAASLGAYTWNNTNYPSSRFARWRVVLESDPSVLSLNGTNFTFRNGPYVYFVNNSSQVGDIYTTAVGNDANLGTTPSAPKATISSVFTNFDLDPGDIVYIDTGSYAANSTISISLIHSGSTSAPVRIIGSTNALAGGTVFTRQDIQGISSDGFTLQPGLDYIRFDNMTVRDRRNGFFLDGNTGVELFNVQVFSNNQSGVSLRGGRDSTFRRVAVFNNRNDGITSSSTNLHIDGSVLWNNSSNALNVIAGAVTVSNTSFGASGILAGIYQAPSNGMVTGNFNHYYTVSNAVLAVIKARDRYIDSLPAWRAVNGSDTRSIEDFPHYVDPENGDFHLRTETFEGRVVPGVGRVNDDVTSPLIDAGNPDADFSGETAAIGLRRNIGFYGNTAEASWGPTAPWIYAAALRQGGWVSGTTILHWVAGNLTNGELAKLEISPDGGESWSIVNTGVTAAAEQVPWDTTQTNNFAAGLFRISIVGQPEVSDTTTNFFAVRNGPISWYVNDASLDDDAFTTAIGAPTNWVATADRPLDSLDSVFRYFDHEAGDTIYVDAGTYTNALGVRIDRRSSGGLTSGLVRVIGAEDCAGLHPVMEALAGTALDMTGVRGLVVSNIGFRVVSAGASLDRTENVSLDRVRFESGTGNGISVLAASNLVLRQSVIRDFAGTGLSGRSNTAITVVNSILWSNLSGAIDMANSTIITVSNSVLTASGSGVNLYSLSSVSRFAANYNNLLVEEGAGVALNNGILNRFVNTWQAATSNDTKSLSHDPLFADAAGGDFHLRSEAGRFDPGTCGFTTDAVTSPMIDAGRAGEPFADETAPNGDRVNIGLYGNTPEAGRSPTNARLLTLSFNGGGVARGVQTLYWLASGPATGDTVRVEYSTDNGGSWTVIASNQAATLEQYAGWDTAALGSFPVVYWRIVSETDPALASSNQAAFTINNGAITYYVNDASTFGDIYTTAAGNLAFDGLDASTPLPSISEVLARYPIGAGDRILIDTGDYSVPGTINLNANYVGGITNPIVIAGSTNFAAGGTSINGNRNGPTFYINNNAGIKLANLRFTNSAIAIDTFRTTNSVLENVTICMPAGLTELFKYGVRLDRVENLTLNRVAVHGLTNRIASAAIRAVNSPGILLESSVIWSNTLGISIVASDITMSNSIVGAIGEGNTGIELGLSSTMKGNYNNVFARGGAYPIIGTIAQTANQTAPLRYESVAEWVRLNAPGTVMYSHDPGFSSPASGEFFLMSEGGRYNSAGMIVTDDVSSVMIDAGDPVRPFSNEPSPNGGRVNLGVHGNTPQASVTQTNIILTAISFNDGGVASGTNVALRWNHSGITTGFLVRVRISYDDGMGWTNIAENVPWTNRVVAWDSTLYPSAPRIRWQVINQSNPSLSFGQNEILFTIHNSNLTYYVNDASTSGDVYSTSAGSVIHDGLTPATPMLSLDDVFDAYNLEPGDTVYVDTGLYNIPGGLTFKQEDAGSPTNPVYIVGSTNGLAGGTRFIGGAFTLDATRGLTLRHLVVDRNGATADNSVFITQATNTVIEYATIIQGGTGINVDDSFNTRLDHVVIRNATTNGIFVDRSREIYFEHGVIWSNRYGVRGLGDISVSNSVLSSFGDGGRIYVVSNLNANFNALLVGNGAYVGEEYSTPGLTKFTNTYASVGQWAQASGRDVNSLALDPGFADTATSDFHLLSTAGRFDPALQVFTNDLSTSPLIDAGAPWSDFSQETPPSGGRVNIGVYGNTPEASRSPTNARLVALAFYDGGIASGTNVLLNWNAYGNATSHSVRLEYSGDAGDNWIELATNLPAGTSSYIWNTTNLPSSVLSLWRVVSETESGVAGEVSVPFAVRNGPVFFYVNDGSTNSDVYTTGVGSPAAFGILPSAPKASIQGIFDAYDLEPGDVVYVDTGLYAINHTITIGTEDAGSSGLGKPVAVVGSTNFASGGTVLQGGAFTPVLLLQSADAMDLRNITILAEENALRIKNSPNFRFSRLQVIGGTGGIFVDAGSTNGLFLNSLVRNAEGAGITIAGTSGIKWDQGILWSNATVSGASVVLQNSSASFSNTVYGHFGSNPVYKYDENSTVQADYNYFTIDEGADIAERTSLTSPLPMRYKLLSRWQRDTGRDRNSLIGDPRFANAIEGDFHPRSAAGRFDPGTGTFVTDPVTSPLIDAGSPNSSFGAETGANGQRANIGMFGNTGEASRSPTNAILSTVSLADGGRVDGTSYPLIWKAYGAATGHTVRLEYSGDRGVSWSLIASGIPARVENYFWDPSSRTTTVLAAWRVISENQPSVIGTNRSSFAVRYVPVAFYVNDPSTGGDMYCSAPGNPLNDGLSPSSPKDSLSDILDTYDLEPGDVVYIDTGAYFNNNTITWSRFDAWDMMTNTTSLRAGGISVSLFGSTNSIAGGSRIIKANGGQAMLLEEAFGVQIRDVRFSNTSPAGTGGGLKLDTAYYGLIEWCRAQNSGTGFEIIDSAGVRMRHVLASANTAYGILSSGSSTTDVRQSVLWSNTVQARVTAGTMLLENSVVAAFGTGSIGLERNDFSPGNGIFISDYNAFYITNGAFFGMLRGNYVGGKIPYEKMKKWQDDTGLDLRSYSGSLYMADPYNGDFHPQSPVGRYLPGSGYVTNAAEVLSPLIDGGRATSAFLNETPYNGLRANIGLYGNTSESSKSPTNGTIRVTTFNDGGSGSGSIPLRWTVSGPAASHQVTIEFSGNGGSSYVTLASNVPANAESYTWNSVPFGRVAAGVWRITSQSDTNLVSLNEIFFQLRQAGSAPYYVNDASTAGDIYCTAPGNNANDGFLPGSPKSSLQNLLDNVDLEPGDIVYIDTGSFVSNVTISVSILDGGTATNPVVFRGSTNINAGGTTFDRVTGVGTPLRFFETEGIRVENMTFRGGQNGVLAEESAYIYLYNITARDNSLDGVRALSSQNIYLDNSLVINNGTNGVSSVASSGGGAKLHVNQSTIWNSPVGVTVGRGCAIVMSNSVVHAFGDNGRIYLFDVAVTNVVADYNNYYRQSGAVVAERLLQFGGSEYYGRLLDWQRAFAQDLHTLSHEPRFGNIAALDAHPRSATGRFLPGGGVTNDGANSHSPLIDTAGPTAVFTNELAPNGNRANIGRYGNTTEASLSLTNPWVLAISVNDGGQVSGTQQLYWATGNMATGDTVQLEYAANGVDYLVVASNIPASQTTYPWDASGEPATQLARWRLVSEQYTGTTDSVDNPFTVKNSSIVVYVNDGSTAGDIYTTAAGSALNTGLTPSDPLSDPVDAIERFPLGPGDTVYIDTGIYYVNDPEGLRLGLIDDQLKGGAQGDPLRIVGSTNWLASGTQIVGLSPLYNLITVADGLYTDIEHLRLNNGLNGIAVTGSRFINIRQVETRGMTNGLYFFDAFSSRVERVASYANNAWAYRIEGENSSVTIDSSISYSNRLGGISLGDLAELSVHNSIFNETRTNALVYSVHLRGDIAGDYNMIWSGNNESFAFNTVTLNRYSNLRAWQRDRDMDFFSVRTDPLFVDPSSGDFHLKSQNGRYNRATQSIQSDGVTSWAIDAANPLAVFSSEPQPNGFRQNIGLYANTGEASRSVTNAAQAALNVVTVDDGGVISGSQLLYWLARGVASNDLVYIDYSPNEGVDWFGVATNVPARAGIYNWDFASITSTPLALWRVTLQSNSNVTDAAGKVFTIRNGPIGYYVNDTNTFGDIFSYAPGSALNDGITSNTPLSSILDVFYNPDFDLEGGDVVYVDTGYYEFDEDIQILSRHSGIPGSRVVVRGSTNWAAGGTVFHRISDEVFGDPSNTNEFIGTYGIRMRSVKQMEVRDLVIEGANIGLSIENPIFPVADGNYIHGLLVRDGGEAAVNISRSSSNRLERVVLTRVLGNALVIAESENVVVGNSVLWSNANNAVTLSASSLKVSNTVLHTYGNLTNVIYSLDDKSVLESDYNNLFVDGASYVFRDGFLYSGLPQWNQAFAQDFHSISVDPLFFNPTNDLYYPLSASGRYDVNLEDFVVTGTNFSWLIDAGSPDTNVDDEPDPNGGRRNIGIHGGTAQASKSRTNAYLLAVTAMAGGRMGDIIQLFWNYGNLDATNRLQLDYSPDLGTNWINIATDVPIEQDGYFWESLLYDPFQSPIAKWRAVLEADTNVYSETMSSFGLNGPFTFFLNDNSLAGDVYTTAVGDDSNLGISSNSPKASLKSVFDTWDVDPEDVVLLDVGTYLIGSNDLAQLRLDDQGSSLFPVTIRGATNGIGATLDGSPDYTSTPINLFDINGAYVVVEDLRMDKGIINAAGTNITFRNVVVSNGVLEMNGTQGAVDNATFFASRLLMNGFGVNAYGLRGYQSQVEMGGTLGVLENSLITSTSGPLLTVYGSNVSVRNSTIVGGTLAVLQTGVDSSLQLVNNILIADRTHGADAQIISREGGTLQSDYNNIWPRSGAWIGNAEGLWEKLIYWQQRSGQDSNSISAAPLFADEAGDDYHLKSSGGRFSGGTFVIDAQDSPAIDAGAPSSPFSLETAPNGGRVNIGAYGNTAQASRSRTNAWLFAITMNDGGVLRGTNVIRWISSGIDASNTVTLQYSANGGGAWSNIAAGVNVAQGFQVWDTTLFESSLEALWRVVLDANTNVYDETDNLFNLRNDVRAFYVNNVSTNGDVYTTAPGNDLNDGLTPATPMASLTNLLATYDTEATDTIFVDTGIYTSSTIRVIWSRGGDSNGNMVIKGSTNTVAGGTVIRATAPNQDAFTVRGDYVTIRDLAVENANRGIHLFSNLFNRVEQVDARNSGYGIALEVGGMHTVRSSRVWNNSGAGILINGADLSSVENVTFVDNRNFGVEYTNTLGIGGLLQNNIFYMDIPTSNRQVAVGASTSTIVNLFVDYNVYYFGPASRSNAFINGNFTNLLLWQRLQSKDFRSAITNPLFANASSGDFHLLSADGRYDPLTGTFVNDGSSSWAIDKGNPNSAFDQEPDFNGERINIGGYGNTPYASKGTTNPVVFLRTGNELLKVTEAENPYPLIWYVLNVPDDVTVTVQYSGDDGNSWLNLQAGVPIYQEYLIWTNSATFNSFKARWRIVGEGGGNTNYWDINDDNIQTFFGVHRISRVLSVGTNEIQFVWRGAWDEDYQIQYAADFTDPIYSTNLPKTIVSGGHFDWVNLGDVTNLVIGGDTVFRDLTFTNDPDRVYRVLWLGTNGVPYQ